MECTLTKLGHAKLHGLTLIQDGVRHGWWDIGSNGEPIRKAIRISIVEMKESNKPLMAHLLADLKIFKSVSEAKRNGWDKPLEPGRHELGPKKNRHTVELV